MKVRVTMLNINYGKNRKLMDACEPLKEYAILVDTVRRHQREKMDLDAAVDAALDGMPEEYLIKTFLMGNRAEVKKMFLTEYNEEKVLEKEREEGRREGREEGRREGHQEGVNQARVENIKNLMESLKLTAKQAMDALKIPDSERERYMPLL